jgi:hypothetical protein
MACALATKIGVLKTALVSTAARASLSTSAATSRWHKDFVENRKIWRYGYEDKLMKSGSLPRTTNDDQRIKPQQIFKPQNPFAPSNALYGQNDYIDILGK